MNRREFLEQAGLAVGGVAGAIALGGCTEQAARESGERASGPRAVTIVIHPADAVAAVPAAQWAVGKLRGALETRHVAVSTANRLEDAPAGAMCVVVAGKSNINAATIAGAAGSDASRCAGFIGAGAGKSGWAQCAAGVWRGRARARICADRDCGGRSVRK